MERNHTRRWTDASIFSVSLHLLVILIGKTIPSGSLKPTLKAFNLSNEDRCPDLNYLISFLKLFLVDLYLSCVTISCVLSHTLEYIGQRISLLTISFSILFGRSTLHLIYIVKFGVAQFWFYICSRDLGYNLILDAVMILSCLNSHWSYIFRNGNRRHSMFWLRSIAFTIEFQGTSISYSWNELICFVC